ncbi:linoleate 9S-lipoxygenase A-like [Ananas comosus]|uniref:Lipoxygenase n=1 Tax=Ananas comosus TaxID=4615 RepID=A0A6P5GP86_ANACO|nr:linoleate 9S-lipoxygenase A-like [Ananas comosus]
MGKLYESCVRCFKPSPAPDQEAHQILKGTVVISQSFGQSGAGKSTTVRLYSSTQVDPNTGRGKLSREATLDGGKIGKHGNVNTVTYQVSIPVENSFGTPGAIVVKNGGRHEFFLKFASIDIHEDRTIHFECNSWVYPTTKTNSDRLFFANTSYLPTQTPTALQKLREEELVNLRGNGRGERKQWERIYDYDYYNDLGVPDSRQRVRPVLGGTKEYPYPRRGRTGRPLSRADGETEKRSIFIDLDFYVPPDERFSPVKLSGFITHSIQAVLHFVFPEVKSLLGHNIGNFESFKELTKDLYARRHEPSIVEGVVMEKLKSLLPKDIYKEVIRVTKENPLKFPVPQVIATDENAWRSDEEFAREMLAGLNPGVIRCLEQFPPIGRGEKYSSINASHIQGKIDGLTIPQALKQKRILILDHHDYLVPYLRRINAQGLCIYASRTLLFLKNDGTLRPLVIELSLPGEGMEQEVSRVFVSANQGTEGALWMLAKAHVAVNDSGYHQLISHWLHTHAAVEPFIIATRRQLSTIHPIYKLLDPHFKDTMHINALARGVLLNAGGVLEKTMFPGKYAMELSSTIYENWRFTEQALPEDLVKRGLAIKDSNQPSGVTLLLEDYPYAEDGLDVWTAIKTWVTNFCSHFYRSDEDIASDVELQSWWKEIREIGHGDKRDDVECWLPLNSLANLIQSLTTLIWIASALHAAVNFGQYGYAGFPPNRPTRCRKFIPQEGTLEFAEFIGNPDKYYLEMVPDRFTTTLGVALIEVLSEHIADEVYIGQRTSSRWTDDGEVLRLFDGFAESLRQVEQRIEERNQNVKLKNRLGPAKVPYTLLFPDISNVGNEKGITGKGIPNSVSI